MSTRIYNLPKVVAITPLAALTADDSNDAGVDITHYEGDLGFVLVGANVAGTTPTLAVKLQHSDDDITYTDVTGGAFTGLTTGTAAPEKLTIQKNALKKYVRTFRDIGGTSSPQYLVGVLMLGHLKYPA